MTILPNGLVGHFRSPQRAATFLGWLAVFVMAALMLTRASTAAYSPDSWSYVDIARSLFLSERGIGEIQGTRDYTNVPWQNDSFPFLWPLLLAPGVAIMGSTFPVGGWIFVSVWLVTCMVLGLTALQLRLPPFIAPLLGLTVLAIPGYVNEGHAGRAIPLNILLLAASLLLLLKWRGQLSMALALGALLGLAAANRFDSLIYGPIVISLALVFRLLSWSGAIVALCGWLVFPLSWAWYSVTSLGGLYITDNSRVALSSSPTFVTDWPAAVGGEQLSAVGLLVKISGSIDLVTASALQAYRYWAAAAVAALAFAFIMARLRRNGPAAMVTRWFADEPTLGITSVKRWTYFLASLAVGLVILQVVSIGSTGYGDIRYWGASSFVIIELSAALSAVALSTRGTKYAGQYAIVLASGIMTFLVMLSGLGLAQAVSEYSRVDAQGVSGPGLPDAAIAECIDAFDGVPIIAGLEAFRVPATTSVRAASPPANATNMTAQDWADLSATYGITLWLNPTGQPGSALPENAKGVLTEISCN